jgi:hypothetical protein
LASACTTLLVAVMVSELLVLLSAGAANVV